MFYYYVVMSRTLDLLGEATVETPDGKKEWARDLATRLVELQSPEGKWVNPEDRWWEGAEVLTTAYGIQALSNCYGNLSK